MSARRCELAGWLAAASLALSGCLDLEGLRERAIDGDAGVDAAAGGCHGDRDELRLWKLHLGQADYVTIKNLGDCSVELSGVEVFFDDHSELFPSYEVDCTVQLPTFALPPGGEVRVHEKPLAGDIAALEHAVADCGGGLSFNPERGGVTYLCDGACDATHVIDAVAHSGETMGPPPLRFDQAFDTPLEGVSVANQDGSQFRRVRTAGRAPSFRASDWQLESRFVHADFESGVMASVGGKALAWMQQTGQSALVSTSNVAAVGEASLRLTHRGNTGRSDGLALTWDPAITPSHVSYFTRIDALPASGACFDLKSKGLSAIFASFAPTGLGTEVANEQRTDVIVSAKAFHQVELRNIDWIAHTYDLYVDRVLVRAEQRFWSNAFSVDQLSLYSVSSDSVVYWDEIELWR